MAVLYCSQPYYTAIRHIVSISDDGSLRTVEAEREASAAIPMVGCTPWFGMVEEGSDDDGAVSA